MSEESKEISPSQAKKASVTRVEQYIGPIPPPSLLQDYDSIVPGSADRILRMAEQQSEHRQFLEKAVITGDNKRADRGLYVGAFVALSVLGGSIYLIANGHDIAGGIIASIDIVGLVSVFIYGTSSRRSEREKKSAVMNRKQSTDNT